MQYLRHGVPTRRSLNQAAATVRYVWRTQNDGKVRRSHRLNDTRLFSYDDPPATGPPGADFGCRCEAVPCIPGKTEFAYHDFTSNFAAGNFRWGDLDSAHHCHYGEGRTVTLREIGHFRAILEHYSCDDGGEGAFRRLADQIATAARKMEGASFRISLGSGETSETSHSPIAGHSSMAYLSVAHSEMELNVR